MLLSKIPHTIAQALNIELLQYYQQQSICNNYHRYGNLGDRALQFKDELLKDELPTSNTRLPCITHLVAINIGI